MPFYVHLMEKATKCEVIILNKLEWKTSSCGNKGNEVMPKGSLGRMQDIKAEMYNILHEINLFFMPKEQDVAMVVF
jgi:hypothetical protein